MGLRGPLADAGSSAQDAKRVKDSTAGITTITWPSACSTSSTVRSSIRQPTTHDPHTIPHDPTGIKVNQGIQLTPFTHHPYTVYYIRWVLSGNFSMEASHGAH